jgi:peroxiredoxin
VRIYHFTIDKMRADAERMKLKTAPDFRLKDPTGKTYTLKEASAGKPTLIVFIKDGCPCSIEAEPVLQALAKHHGDKIRLVGIIDKGPKEAKEWIKNHESRYLILCDPDK